MEESMEELMAKQVPDWEVAEWEEKEDELLLLVCSTCGLIASEMVDHGDCNLQDWWHLNAKCFVKPEVKQ